MLASRYPPAGKQLLPDVSVITLRDVPRLVASGRGPAAICVKGLGRALQSSRENSRYTELRNLTMRPSPRRSSSVTSALSAMSRSYCSA